MSNQNQNLTEEIYELISKNLPAQTVGVIQERLKQADEYQSRILTLEKNIKDKDFLIEDKNSLIIELQTTINAYKEFDDRNFQLDNREKELNEKELRLETEELKYQLASEREKTEFTKNIALGLVRNTEYRKILNYNNNDTINEQPNANNNYQEIRKMHNKFGDINESLTTE